MAEPAKPDPYLEWHKSRPKSPEEPLRTTRFEPPQQCGQGPYRFTVETASAPFSESFEVTLCVKHAFKGTVSHVAPTHGKSERGFGSNDTHHDKCRADATVVTTTSKTTDGKAGKAGKPDGKGTTGSKKTTTVAPVELTGVVVTDGKCPTGTQSITLTSQGYTVGDDPGSNARPPLARGPFVLEMWSELPNDLAGASILVEQRAVRAGYPRTDWIAYRRAYREWYEQHDAKLAESRSLGHGWRTVEPIAPTAQPPAPRAETQPPRPSPNAGWIPGYWQFTDGWVWSAGFWRVPPKDVEQERTVEAPAPPPAPRVEKAPEVAYHSARKAIWTPGHWMWDGRGYIWIAGAWRIPEAAQMTWVAPAWRPTRRGTLMFVPGGFVRIRR